MTQSLRYNSEFLRQARERGWLADSEFVLVDVGASGGIDAFWNQFRPHLRAIGFDPLVNEVARLNAAEADPKIRYDAAWVGDGTPRAFTQGCHTVFSFSSAWRAADAKQRNYAKEYFNSGLDLIYADRHIRLDDALAPEFAATVDVLKTDVDSFDFYVLEGALHLLQQRKVLLVQTECVFHELVGGAWPVFADIDTLMRRAGYRLMDLSAWNYTRRELPARFRDEIPAQTVGGQVSWCDALYVLDVSLDASALDRLRDDPLKLIKAAVLQEAFGYPDVSAATLLRLRDAGLVPTAFDLDAALDMLVPENPYGLRTYAEYLAGFDSDPDRFLPSRWAAAVNARSDATSEAAPAETQPEQREVAAATGSNGGAVRSPVRAVLGGLKRRARHWLRK